MPRAIATVLVCLTFSVGASAQQPAARRPAFPVKASADGCFPIDRRGQPFFYHADTACGAVKKVTRAEFESYLDRRVADGFTAVAGAASEGAVTSSPAPTVGEVAATHNSQPNT